MSSRRTTSFPWIARFSRRCAGSRASSAADARDEVLAQVAIEVEEEVADGVRGGALALPELGVGEEAGGLAELGQVLVAERGRRAAEEDGAEVGGPIGGLLGHHGVPLILR